MRVIKGLQVFTFDYTLMDLVMAKYTKILYTSDDLMDQLFYCMMMRDVIKLSGEDDEEEE